MNNYKFYILDPNKYKKLSELAAKVELDEKIDFKCTFMVANGDAGELIGFVGVNFLKQTPRFEHVVIDERYQKTSLGYRLCVEMEDFVKDLGYKSYYAYVPNENEYMQEYAKKFGFIQYNECNEGKWYSKQLQGDIE